MPIVNSRRALRLVRHVGTRKLIQKNRLVDLSFELIKKCRRTKACCIRSRLNDGFFVLRNQVLAPSQGQELDYSIAD